MGPLSSPAVTARVVVVDDDDEVREVTVDGPTLYREVLARWPAAASHVLFVSGVAEMPHPDDTVKALNIPVLLKPFTLEALRAAVARVLATI
jgi:DNA-binding response OmpR family regulator